MLNLHAARISVRAKYMVVNYLQPPESGDFENLSIPAVRLESEFEGFPERFSQLAPENQLFEKQFASNYFVRLHALKNAAYESAKCQWSATPILESITDYRKYPIGTEIAIVGTVFKDMKLKPNVLDELQKYSRVLDQYIVPPSVNGELTRSTADSDFMCLEDAESRMQITFESDSARQLLNRLCTGLIVAAKGSVTERGHFNLTDVCLPGTPPQPPLPLNRPSEYIVLISGLNVGSPQSRPAALDLLKDFLIGVMDPIDVASSTSRAIFLGNSIHLAASGLAIADTFFSEVAAVMPVELVPGPSDPTNFAMPQQPMHSSLFPLARQYSNFNGKVTNPCACRVGGIDILGISGQGVTEVLQYTDLPSPLDAMELCLRARHLAPTAPDTLACYPITSDCDPLIIDAAPHVFVSGNSLGGCACRVVDGVLCVSLSAFSQTAEVVVVNVADPLNDWRVVGFGAPDY